MENRILAQTSYQVIGSCLEAIYGEVAVELVEREYALTYGEISQRVSYWGGGGQPEGAA